MLLSPENVVFDRRAVSHNCLDFPNDASAFHIKKHLSDDLVLARATVSEPRKSGTASTQSTRRAPG
jgi:hypothetical protein